MAKKCDDAENQLDILEQAMSHIDTAASELFEMEGKIFTSSRCELRRRLQILERQAQFLRAKIHQERR
jgi:hypothetical protein